MDLCTFAQIKNGWWQCTKCKFIYSKDIPKPPKRNCPKPPEPRHPDDVAYILETLCPECKHYHWPDKTCHCKCSKGTPVGILTERGSCPAWRW